MILHALIIYNNTNYPLYFSMWNYSKKKEQYDNKKLEEALIKMLKQWLSKNYNYIIVADSGFKAP